MIDIKRYLILILYYLLLGIISISGFLVIGIFFTQVLYLIS
jgi:hypothetical protein